MRTRLRTVGFVVVASLLWTSTPSAATQRANGQKATKKPKVSYLGTASWYGKQRQGRKMANGKRFDCQELTAASWYFPLGTLISVVNTKNGQSVIVTITDRGPNLRLHRILDLSEAAATDLDYIAKGLTTVFISPMVPIQTASAAFDSQLIEPSSDNGSGEYETSALIRAM